MIQETKILSIVGIVFIPLGIAIFIFNKFVGKIFCKIAKYTWKDIPEKISKIEIIKEISESAKKTYTNLEKTSDIIKWMGLILSLTGVIFMFFARIFSKL